MNRRSFLQRLAAAVAALTFQFRPESGFVWRGSDVSEIKFVDLPDLDQRTWDFIEEFMLIAQCNAGRREGESLKEI